MVSLWPMIWYRGTHQHGEYPLIMTTALRGGYKWRRRGKKGEWAQLLSSHLSWAKIKKVWCQSNTGTPSGTWATTFWTSHCEITQPRTQVNWGSWPKSPRLLGVDHYKAILLDKERCNKFYFLIWNIYKKKFKIMLFWLTELYKLDRTRQKK